MIPAFLELDAIQIVLWNKHTIIEHMPVSMPTAFNSDRAHNLGAKLQPARHRGDPPLRCKLPSFGLLDRTSRTCSLVTGSGGLTRLSATRSGLS